MSRERSFISDTTRATEVDVLLGRTRDSARRALRIEDLDGIIKERMAKIIGSLAVPWSVIHLPLDFTTTSAAAVDVTGLAFPVASRGHYQFEADLLVRTATATVGPRPGLAWATGLADGAATIRMPSAARTEVLTNGTIAAALLAPVGGLPDTVNSYLATIRGICIAGAAPTGHVRLQLASETAGTQVILRAGSSLRYRRVR